ncbi:hypothetical protein [Streptomyces sp. NPDC037389]|uniref:hypothetical protein n=1 Tax=Streptomyces sp. NPDC037389 TaxID=3155369 RepID=UPI0033EE3C2D
MDSTPHTDALLAALAATAHGDNTAAHAYLDGVFARRDPAEGTEVAVGCARLIVRCLRVHEPSGGSWTVAAPPGDDGRPGDIEALDPVDVFGARVIVAVANGDEDLAMALHHAEAQHPDPDRYPAVLAALFRSAATVLGHQPGPPGVPAAREPRP